jgi:hypothetical protein
MKEQKRLGQGPTEEGFARIAASEDKNGVGEASGRPVRSGEMRTLRPEPKMHSELPTRAHSRKQRGRLNRETLIKLGKVLGDYYDHVRHQDVPDRILDLLEQMEERKERPARVEEGDEQVEERKDKGSN